MKVDFGSRPDCAGNRVRHKYERSKPRLGNKQRKENAWQETCDNQSAKGEFRHKI